MVETCSNSRCSWMGWFEPGQYHDFTENRGKLEVLALRFQFCIVSELSFHYSSSVHSRRRVVKRKITKILRSRQRKWEYGSRRNSHSPWVPPLRRTTLKYAMCDIKTERSSVTVTPLGGARASTAVPYSSTNTSNKYSMNE